MEQLNSAIRHRMVSGIVREVSGDSSSEHGSVENTEEGNDESQEESGKVIKILKVLTMKNTHDYNTNCEIIVDAMKMMHMKKREKGSVSNERKFKSLTGRWFGEKKKEVIDNKKGKILEQGSVIKLINDHNAPSYIVFVVWRNNGSKKWFPLLPEENPSWPLTKEQAKQYCVGIWIVDVEENDEGK